MTTSSNLTELGQLAINKSHKFILTLTAGEFPIDIVSISAGCSSCTTVATSANRMGPNETITLNVTFTPNNLGFQTKMIHITYKEDHKQLKTTLKFTATVYA